LSCLLSQAPGFPRLASPRRRIGEMPTATLPSQAPRRIASSACCCFATATLLATSTSLFSNSLSGFASRSLGITRPRARTLTAPLRMSTSGNVGSGDGVVIQATSGAADSSVIFLHGLGDTAAGWVSAFPFAGLPNTRYVLPTAPTTPVSLNMGYKMPSWFDLYGLDPSAPDDVPGIAKAVARLNQIIDGMHTFTPSLPAVLTPHRGTSISHVLTPSLL
jgi:hypothetical protein